MASNTNEEDCGDEPIIATTTTDAGFHRFLGKNRRGSTETPRCHCRQCDEYFPDFKKLVNQHFKDKKHDPLEEKCQYCKGNVFSYFVSGKIRLHHRCTYSERPLPTDNPNVSAATSIDHLEAEDFDITSVSSISGAGGDGDDLSASDATGINRDQKSPDFSETDSHITLL